MGTPVWIAVATASAVVLVVLVLCVLRLRRAGARARAELAAATVVTQELRARLEELADQVAALTRPADDAAYLITDAGQPRPEPNVPDRLVLSATLGEPLVKVAALGHGVRRALAPESRNRIVFAMRREVRRQRKHRRREMKEAWRRMQAEDRAA